MKEIKVGDTLHLKQGDVEIEWVVLETKKDNPYVIKVLAKEEVGRYSGFWVDKSLFK